MVEHCEGYEYRPPVHATPNGHTHVVAIDTLRVRLFGVLAEPMPRVPFEIEFPDGRKVAGRANRAGDAIVRQGVGAIDRCIVRWGPFDDGVHPRDARLSFAYERELSLAAATQDVSDAQRLYDLGYCKEAKLQECVWLYQTCNGIEATGKLSQDNTRELIEHDHHHLLPVREPRKTQPPLKPMQVIPKGEVRSCALPMPWIRARLVDEAFHENEASERRTPSGNRFNRYANVGTTREGVTLDNPIHDHELTDEQRAVVDAAGWRKSGYDVYVAPGSGASGPLKVALFFGVGTELRRFGLRSLFQRPGHALIIVSGIERWKSNPLVKAGKPKNWGIGVDRITIDALLAAAGFGGAQWHVDVMAAYSTGYRGFSGTINFAHQNPGVLDLSRVKRAALYDCLYRGDTPHPGDGTRRALAALNHATGAAVKLAVYDVTTGGTPHKFGDTAVPQQWLRDTFGGRYTHVELRAHHAAIQVLLCCRLLEVANGDGFLGGAAGNLSDHFRRPELAHVARLMDGLPERWTLGSTKPALTYGSTPLVDWITANAADIKQMHAPRLHRDFVVSFGNRVGFPRSVNFINKAIIDRFNLADWVADLGERVHDSFIPEFGHEMLQGDIIDPNDIYADLA